MLNDYIPSQLRCRLLFPVSCFLCLLDRVLVICENLFTATDVPISIPVSPVDGWLNLV